jgi:hypothetical protein
MAPAPGPVTPSQERFPANVNPFSLEEKKAEAPAASANPFSLDAPTNYTPTSPEVPDLKDVPGLFAKNFLPSLGSKISGAYNAVTEHPLDTATNLLVHDNPLLAPGLYHYTVNAAKELLNKYGSYDKIKTTAAEDPSGLVMDLMSFVPGVGAPSKATGIVGKVTNKAAQIADPAQALSTLGDAVKLGGDVTKHTANHATQILEGIGDGAVQEVFNSGKAVTPGVWKTITGGLDFDKSYDLIKNSLSKLFEQRGGDYELNMSKVEGANKPVDFGRVDKAIQDAQKIGTYKAPGDTTQGIGYRIKEDPSVGEMRKSIQNAVEEFKLYGDPYHTAIGFDKLKRSIHNLGEGQRVGSMPTPGSLYASKVEQAIKKTIMDAVPEYGKAMESYGTKSDQLTNLMKEFSLQDGANKLTTLRKLQKVWRQSADVAHGERTNVLREAVEQAGNPHLMSLLAAGQFHPIAPRGLRGSMMPLEALQEPTRLGVMAPFMSPRVTGMAAYGLGRFAGSPLGRGAATGYRAAAPASTGAARAARWGLPQPQEQQQPTFRKGGFFSKRA